MIENQSTSSQADTEEFDELAELVKRESITAECWKIDVRPDVSFEDQREWAQQDPDYPPEHYRCLLKRAGHELELYQSVGADYPDEDEDADNSDLYRDARELLLSAEFIIESAALKANSVDEAQDVAQWMSNGYCQTSTPVETYSQYGKIRDGLRQMLGSELYNSVVALALAAELEVDEESEE